MGGTRDHFSSVECISIEKRGFRPNRYYVYVVIVSWNNGDKHPIYRKYSSFYDFERMLREKHGNVGIPELPPMNVLEKAFRIEKNHVTEINEFCQKVLALPSAIVNSHSVIAFFEAWSTDYWTEDVDERTARKRDDKRKIAESSLDKQESLDTDQTRTSWFTESVTPVRVLPSPPESNNNQALTSIEDDLMKMEVYVCIEDYIPDGAGELSLNKGAKCVVLEKNGDGWWFIMRESDGHQGYAPGSFLCLDSAKVTEHHEYAEIVPSTKYQVTADDSHSVIIVRAVTSYESKNDDEISCQAGQELEVIEMDSSGWWTVRNGGKVGLVPAVHLEPKSTDTARTSQVILRNNSLYARGPPPRRHDSPSQTLAAPLETQADPAYISLEYSPNMAAKRLVPPASRSKTEGLLNYVEIAFDDESNQPKLNKASTQALLAVNKPDVKKQDSIVYTQIVPRNLRQPEEVIQTASANGKKPERGKALKKHPIPKIEEPKHLKGPTSSPRSTPGRGSPVLTKPQQLQDSPILAKPRIARPQEPQRNYENHAVASTQSLNASVTESTGYSNVPSISTQQQTNDIVSKKTVTPEASEVAKQQNVGVHSREKPALSDTSNPAKKNGITTTKVDGTPPKLREGAPEAREKPKRTVAQKSLDNIDYLRRSSIEPPPAPSVEAPIPSTVACSHSSLESYSPSLSRAQAICSYDGPPISGMLMFTKGDIATVMSKSGGMGWWYVNLKGLEGYVPGGYWEACSKSASPLPRAKVPQPKPRNRSPPTSERNAPNSERNAPTSERNAPTSERSIYENEAWYHGKLSRPECEKLLANFPNGIYVIRESVNRVGDLTLSVRWEGKTRHFPIEAKDGGLFYIGKHDFKTLKSVITHYSKHALFYTEANEPAKLKTPATKLNTYSPSPR